MARINTTFGFTDNVTNPLKRMTGQLNNTSNAFNNLTMKMLGINQAIALISMSINAVRKANDAMNNLTRAYEYQAEQELKLETIMKQRMNASEMDIQAIKDLASAQQQLGIYGDEVILQGAQELASFTSNRQALEALIPAMNDLIAQQYGYAASGKDFQTTADMMGKVLSGQTGALSRMGYVFSEEEKQMLKTGDEMQRASTLAKIITDNVGHMNQALAKTDSGAIQNATNRIGDFYERLGKSLVSLKNAFSQIKTSILLYFETPIIQAVENIKRNMGAIIATIINIGSIVAITATTMAVAWAVINWPITITVALLITVVRMMYDLTSSANQASEAMRGFGNQCEQAGATFGYIVGFIGGTVVGLINIIYNVLGVVYNALMYVSEFVLNIFTHPINAIGRLFLDLANTILQVLSTVAGAVDLIFNTHMSEALNNASKTIEGFKEKNLGNVNFKYQKMNLKDVTGIATTTAKGGEIGRDLGKILDSKFGKFTPQDLSALKQDFKTNANGALLVSDVNTVNIAEDYKELLSKRAVERFNLSFNQVTPEVNVGEIVVNNGTDVETIVDTIVDGARQAQSNSLRG